MVNSIIFLLTLVAPVLANIVEESITPTYTTLYNDVPMPLVGAGVGNLQHELIPQVLRSLMDHEKNVLLIDTARASRNEEYIVESISHYLPQTKIEKDDVINIVTKVWYTHLGYERTKISVHESLKELSTFTGPNPIHVHVLLHWPRCMDEIEWMNCEQEENNLPQYVKDAGPPPHLNPQTAWRDSWKALEDIYTEHQNVTNDLQVEVSSIGVSNFDFNELNMLVSESRIKPHMIQGNVWQVLFDEYTMKFVKEQNIFFQAYNVMNGIFSQKSKATNALSLLSDLSHALTQKMIEQNKGRESELMPLTEAMVVSAWLLQQGIGIIPRASNNHHQWENAPKTLQFVPALNSSDMEVINMAVQALLTGEDVTVKATFQNNIGTGPIHVYWVDKETGNEHPVIENLEPGKSSEIKTHPEHSFIVYDEGKGQRLQLDVEVFYGERTTFQIDEF